MTIDVLPLSDELSGDNVPDNSEKEPIILESAEQLPENVQKKRGRPAGSEDGTKRKMPTRKKRIIEAIPEPVIIPETIIDSKKAPKKPKTPKNTIENEKLPAMPPIQLAPPPMTAAAFLREMQRQQRAGQEDHWSKILGPMFVH